MLKIDLGCGGNKVEGCIGVDSHKNKGVDIIADVRYRITELESKCADYVVCRHVLEHLPGDDYKMVLMEISRLLVSGGQFEIRVPHPSCKNAMITGHCHVLTPFFWEAIRDGRHQLNLPLEIREIEEVPYPPTIEFCRKQGLDWNEWSHRLFDAFYETIIRGVKK